MTNNFLLKAVNLQGSVVDIAIADGTVQQIGSNISLDGAVAIDCTQRCAPRIG